MNSHSFVPKKLHLALVAGAAAVFAAAPSAEAAVVVVDLSAAPINVTNSIDGVYLNVVTGVASASAAGTPGWDINPYNNGAGLTFYGAASPSGVLATGTAGTGAVATALSVGATISAAGQYNQFQTQGTAFQAAGTSYLGFRFLNESTSLVNYGWLLLSTGATAGFPAAILAYGYENAGGVSTAGAGLAPVPEPSTYAMFGLAFAAAAGWRSLKGRRAA
jgi:hypothetical protein